MRIFPFAIAAVCALAGIAAPARADECHDTIAAMFFGGPLDPTQRPPHHQYVHTIDPSGAVIGTVEALWETPLKSLTISNGNYLIAIGNDTWMATSADGPWQAVPNAMQMDRLELNRRHREQLRANMTEAQCLGTFDIAGVLVEKYVYRSRIDPDATGMYFGSLDTIYVDKATNQVVRWDAAESIASWNPDMQRDVQITQMVYDPAIRVNPPQ